MIDSLSATQLEILNIVWEKGDAGVAEIWAELGKRRPIARNTVQTMVSRLAAKGLLRHRQEGNAFVYTAAQPRQRVIGGLVSRLVENAFGGSASGLVLSLLENGKLSQREADRIKQIIDDAADRRGRKSGKEAR